MADVIGDLSHLRLTRIAFNAVHEVSGAEGSGHFSLLSAKGVKHLIGARALVKIVSDSLTCQVIGPASADKAVSAHIAVIPSTSSDWPSTASEVLTIGGSAFIQHSLYVGALAAPLQFTQEVAHQIKPAPVVGSPPEVVYQFTITGGSASSKAYLRISGVLEVDGVGFVASWK
jgi:hypothetical protein